jgi:ABC-type branched-subunit amino acid transport system substrate-binding protein
MRRSPWVVAVLVSVALVAAGCGRDEDPPASEASGSQAEGASADASCEGVELEATDVGVTADTITIQVMADVGSPLAPGLFQGNLDAVEAFAEHVNARGGIACRQLVVETWDTKLTPEEAKNGQIHACQVALALVGGNVLFNPDVTAMEGCDLPNLAGLAADNNEMCSSSTYLVQAVDESCPVAEGAPREIATYDGAYDWYLEEYGPDLHGVALIAGDVPSTVQAGTLIAAAFEQAGVTWDDRLKTFGSDPQTAYTPKVQALKQHGGNFVYGAANDTVMVNMMRETAAQGYDGVELWACILSCYTRETLAAGDVVEGLHVSMGSLPFEEADTNEALRAYVEGVGVADTDSFGANAWQAAMLFEHVVRRIVAADGPNAITRQRILEELPTVDDFTADGWLGTEPKDLRGMTSCTVIMKVEDGAFVRVHPSEPGTLDCDTSDLGTIMLDPAAEAGKLR